MSRITNKDYVHRYNESTTKQSRDTFYKNLNRFPLRTIKLGPANYPSGEAMGFPMLPKESEYLVGVYQLENMFDAPAHATTLEQAIGFQREAKRLRITPKGWIDDLGRTSTRDHNWDDPTVLEAALFDQPDPAIYLKGAKNLLEMYGNARLPSTYLTCENLKGRLITSLKEARQTWTPQDNVEKDMPEKIMLYWNLLEQFRAIDAGQQVEELLRAKPPFF